MGNGESKKPRSEPTKEDLRESFHFMSIGDKKRVLASVPEKSRRQALLDFDVCDVCYERPDVLLDPEELVYENDSMHKRCNWNVAVKRLFDRRTPIERREFIDMLCLHSQIVALEVCGLCMHCMKRIEDDLVYTDDFSRPYHTDCYFSDHCTTNGQFPGVHRFSCPIGCTKEVDH